MSRLTSILKAAIELDGNPVINSDKSFNDFISANPHMKTMPLRDLIIAAEVCQFISKRN